jgi:hypothetical protein
MSVYSFGSQEFSARQAWRWRLLGQLERGAVDLRLSEDRRASNALAARRLKKLIEMQDAKKTGEKWHPGYFH